jgi:hypothetical protein
MFELLFGTRCAWGGTNKTIGPVPFRIDLMGDREGRY